MHKGSSLYIWHLTLGPLLEKSWCKYKWRCPTNVGVQECQHQYSMNKRNLQISSAMESWMHKPKMKRESIGEKLGRTKLVNLVQRWWREEFFWQRVQGIIQYKTERQNGFKSSSGVTRVPWSVMDLVRFVKVQNACHMQGWILVIYWKIKISTSTKEGRKEIDEDQGNTTTVQ